MDTMLEKGTQFIWANARLLERAVFEYRFRGGSGERIVDILRTYQNADGGFGHALEPDLRAAHSQPIFIEFALRTLYDCRLRSPEIAQKACDFLVLHADLTQGIPTIFPSSQSYPHADHWGSPWVIQPSFDRLTALVGLALWQGIEHAWLDDAVRVCVEHIATHLYTDAHTIQNAFCLVDALQERKSLSPNLGDLSPGVDDLFTKLATELFAADFFCLQTPVVTYGLTPLEFAPSPQAFCRRLFSAEQIEAHLDDLASKQAEDGGWPITWHPPAGIATCEWRAYSTVKALSVLRNYGRI